jgi:hypothetical protein
MLKIPLHRSANKVPDLSPLVFRQGQEAGWHLRIRSTYHQRRNHESQAGTRQAERIRRQITTLGDIAKTGRDNNNTGHQLVQLLQHYIFLMFACSVPLTLQFVL